MRHCFRFFPPPSSLPACHRLWPQPLLRTHPRFRPRSLVTAPPAPPWRPRFRAAVFPLTTGPGLTLQVKNLGGTAILVTLDKDPETCITIEPGASGTLTTELSAVPSDHLFQLRAAQAGAELYAAHTLIQSTKKPAESVLPDSAGFPIRPQVPA